MIDDNFISKRLKEVKPGTINVVLRHLKSAFNYAVDHEMVNSNPFLKIKMLKVVKKGREFFTTDDLEKIASVITRQDDHQMMRFLLLTGIRIGELLSLNWSNIHLDQQIIKVLGKGSKLRVIGISADLGILINEIDKRNGSDLVFPGLRSSPNGIMVAFGKRSYPRLASRFKRHFNNAGVMGTLHKFRHTFASHMIMNGVGERALQLILGHESISTTTIYSHLSRNYLKDAMDKIKIDTLLKTQNN